MDIVLKRPTKRYTRDIEEFRREILEANDKDAFAGCFGLEKCESVADWIEDVDKWRSAETSVLRAWGGHIGYSVRPSERGKGYAKEML